MEYVIKIMPQLLTGLQTTLLFFIIVLVISAPIGVVVALCRKSKCYLLKKVFDIYVLIMRGTPLLLQVVIMFFGLPIIGIKFDRFTAGVIAFTLNYAAYFGEIFRSGINSIDQGQYEASEVLGFSSRHTFFRVILPQAIKRVIPPVANEITVLVKDTSLIYVLGMDELLKVAKIASNRDVTLFPLILCAFIYLIVIGVVSKAMQKVEKKYEYYS
ncbi:amino acid ABC transporter permease [Clostridium sp. BJN0001]|uniref:amino acid ABC transporter permease n=1 Tax=Clostridium sp. BJN0001 TaxID=2930219 RepID=UPI001FD4D84A|nr:amino acid ABC transporter permease [Clostridium sp. BJN0001]